MVWRDKVFTLTSCAALNTQQVPELVLQNNSIYCHVRGALWSQQDLEPSWKSVTVPANERLNPALLSLWAAPENLSGDKTTPSRAENCTVTSLPQHLPFIWCCTHHSTLPASRIPHRTGICFYQVLPTSQPEKIVSFNHHPGKFSSRRASNSYQGQLWVCFYLNSK